jgi:hypothetical protein
VTLRYVPAAAFLGCALMVGVSLSTGYRRVRLHEPGENARPLETLDGGYVGSEACRSCHPWEHSTWHTSFHRTMTQKPTPGAVLGRFDGTELEAEGRRIRLVQDGDDFWAEFRDIQDAAAAGAPVRRRIVLMTGAHHQQIYWMDSGIGRAVEMLPVAWLIEEQRWRPFKSLIVRPPDSHIMPESDPGEWNRNCNRCHATFTRPNVGFEVDTRVVEFGISCEECHGPGGAHVHANMDPGRRFRQWLRSGPDTSIVQPARLDHRLSSQVCGQCHAVTLRDQAENARWNVHGFSYEPGDDLGATQTVVRRDEDSKVVRGVMQEFPLFLETMFWSDGVVRAAGREYSGFLGSGCFEKGTISCVSCHVMHEKRDDPRPRQEWRNDQLHAEGLGNRACTQCHPGFEKERDLVAHTHHRADSEGSSCYNCHMPHTTWALLKAVRNHHIDSPTVQSSLDTGRPNACNLCHLDQPLAWTAEHLHRWYGTPTPALGHDDSTVSAGVRWTLSGDAGQRALLAWSYGWPAAQQASGTAWMAPHLGQLLEDPYDVVRYVAHRSLRSRPQNMRFEYDHMDPAAARAGAAERVLELWMQGGVPPEARRASVLVDPQGRLLHGAVQRLLAARDNRDVVIAE